MFCSSKTFSTSRLSARAESRSWPKGFSKMMRDQPFSLRLSPASARPETISPASGAVEIVSGLAEAGLNLNEKGWSRIILEKPFGHDLDSARALNREVLKVFDEQNIHRIDHYLGKKKIGR